MKIFKNMLMTTLRNKNSSRPDFRYATRELAYILAHEATACLQTKTVTIETPLMKTEGLQLDTHIVLLPILRSGLALLPPFLEIYPQSQVGFIGLKRDEETAQAHLYYQNIPPIKSDVQVIILDPMLATGGSLAATLSILINNGIKEEQILFVGVICAQEGLDKIKKEFPKLRTIIAAHDSKLNNKKYIEPGLGDFGDRYFGTE